MSRNERIEMEPLAAVESLVEDVLRVAEDVRTAGAAVKSAARDVTAAARENARAFSKQGWQMAQACETNFETHIRAHPIVSIVAAAGAGFTAECRATLISGRRHARTAIVPPLPGGQAYPSTLGRKIEAGADEASDIT